MGLYLVRRTARSVVVVLLLAVALGAVASSIRLMPWLASPQVPLSVCWAFAQVLLLASTEVALLLAPPLGACLQAADWCADGTRLALSGAGVGPRQYARHAALVALVCALLASGVSFSWARRAQAPGLLSNDLLAQSASGVCSQTELTVVPLVKTSWLCLQGRPTLVGVLGPETQPVGAWRASEGRFSEDLSSVWLRQVHLQLRSPALQLEVESAHIRGLAPWLAASQLGAWSRALCCALACLLSTWAGVYALIDQKRSSRLQAVALGVSGPLAFLTLGLPLAQRSVWLGLAATALGCALAPVAAAALLTAGTRLAQRLNSKATGRAAKKSSP